MAGEARRLDPVPVAGLDWDEEPTAVLVDPGHRPWRLVEDAQRWEQARQGHYAVSPAGRIER